MTLLIESATPNGRNVIEALSICCPWPPPAPPLPPFQRSFFSDFFTIFFVEPKCRRHAIACAHKKKMYLPRTAERNELAAINWPGLLVFRSRSRSPTDLHIDGAARNEKRLLKLIPHQSFNKRACRPSSKRRLRLDQKAKKNHINIYIYIYKKKKTDYVFGVCLRKLHMRIGFN